MKETELIALLQSENPDIDAKVKANTLAAAMAEFESSAATQTESKKVESFFQGFLRRLRLTRTNTIKREENLMKTFSKNWLLGGLGSTAAVVTGFILIGPSMHKSPDGALGELYAPADLVLSDDSVPSSVPPMAELEEVVVMEIRDSQLEKKVMKHEVSELAGRVPAESIAALPSTTNVSALMRTKESSKLAAAPQPLAKSKQVADNISMPVETEHRDQFKTVDANSVKKVSETPVSTFSIDVDTASYSFVRRSLNDGHLPQKAAVRTEEMLNYFDYSYPLAEDKKQPFKPTVVVTDAPWSKPGENKKLLHIGIKGYDIAANEQPNSNLVFLLDVSGSMNSRDKLPLVKQSMHLLLEQLKPTDTVAIAVYAGAAGTVLEPTAVKDKAKIMDALDRLSAGGGTAGAQGIELAYALAERNFDKNAVNRIILATDGDFNVGISQPDALKGFVERKREKGIFLSVLGFGRGNYNDHLMQELAQNGNGVAAYIDTLSEAQKVLVHEATSSLFPIAKDVKIQLEFNPEKVSEYRLLGYETRALKREDFNNDKVDAGDIGAGHTVTAIYEFVPTASAHQQIDNLRYASTKNDKKPTVREYGFLKLRYKLPNEKTSKLIEKAITAEALEVNASLLSEINFATAVAGFAELLKGGQNQGEWGFDQALALAQANKGEDTYGYRTEFVQLVRKAMMAKAM